MSVWKGVKYLWPGVGAWALCLSCGGGFWDSVDRAKITAARTQIDHFLTALGTYREDVGTFPTTDEGLQALRENPGHSGWDGPYLLKDIPRDPWGAPYIYLYPGTHGKRPDLISLGADRQSGGEGVNADIVSWQR